jgi:hypothetical protein
MDEGDEERRQNAHSPRMSCTVAQQYSNRTPHNGTRHMGIDGIRVSDKKKDLQR